MTTKNSQIERIPIGSWKHLLFAAESLVELPRNEKVIAEVRRLLDSLEEHFPRSIDPVEDFPAYSVRRFCLALNSLFEDLEKDSADSTTT